MDQRWNDSSTAPAQGEHTSLLSQVTAQPEDVHREKNNFITPLPQSNPVRQSLTRAEHGDFFSHSFPRKQLVCSAGFRSEPLNDRKTKPWNFAHKLTPEVAEGSKFLHLVKISAAKV